MSDEPFITLPYAKPAPADRSCVAALMPLSWLVVGLAIWGVWTMQPCSQGCGPGTVDYNQTLVSSVFSTPLELFKMHVGRYPQRLDELHKPSANSVGWQGPYIKHETKFKDGRGQNLIYQYPGLHSKSSYDLSSRGPDGAAGTADDITNW